MNFSTLSPPTPPTYTGAGPARSGHSVRPSDSVPPHEITSVEVVKGWIGDPHYDDRLSVADNIVHALNSGVFPTAAPITLRGIVFDLGWAQEIIFPDNVTLDACQVISGQVTFHHGTAEAVQEGAVVAACGEDATANASVDSAGAYARAPGATANATADGAWANAEVSGATANATAKGAKAYAAASGATANARATGTSAFAEGGATANATAAWAAAYTGASGATVNATAKGALAYADAFGATANATAAGAKAVAMACGAIANARAAGAQACASRPGAIAIAGDALASVSVGQGKAIHYGEFKIISGKLNKFWDMRKTNQERADAGYMTGMAFCDGKGVKQSDTLATFFLSEAHELGHLRAAFELGELYSKKRSWFRQDQELADRWYSKEPLAAKRLRELAPKYALLLAGLEDAHSALHHSPKDVINVIGSFLGRL